MSIKVKNKIIPILLGFLVFVVIFLFACFEEENILFNNDKNNEVDFVHDNKIPKLLPEVVATDEEVTITSTSDPIDIGGGPVMFEIELDAILKQQNLSSREKQLISDIIDYLKTGKYLIEKVTIKGYKNSYYDKEKTDIAYKSIYHKTKYFIDGNLSYETQWKYQRKENQNGILFSVGGNNNNPYCLVSVEFEEGTGWHGHRSTFTPNNTQHANVWNAINHGVSGHLYFDVYANAPSSVQSTGKTITNTFLNLLNRGRLKLLSGYVIEGRYYRNTATEVLAPFTLNNGGSVTLRLYTEDEGDFDYNDSYVTITVTNGVPPVLSANDNMVTVQYNEEVQEFIGDADIDEISISYREGENGSWIDVSSSSIQIINETFQFNIPNFSTNTQIWLRENQ